MLVAGFPAGSWATNCYVLATGPGEPCLIVDPGQDAMPGVLDLVEEHRLVPAAVLLTHGHIDHVWSVAPVSVRFGIPAVIHEQDRYRLADPAGSSLAAPRETLRAMTRDALELSEPEDVQVVSDDDVLDIAGLSLRVRHAPGHTEGSVVFELGDTMVAGDVLFAGSIGRTDLPGGNHEQMLASLSRVILPAPDDMRVLPGHGSETTIGIERATNPFLRALIQDQSVPARRTGL